MRKKYSLSDVPELIKKKQFNEICRIIEKDCKKGVIDYLVGYNVPLEDAEMIFNKILELVTHQLSSGKRKYLSYSYIRLCAFYKRLEFFNQKPTKTVPLEKVKNTSTASIEMDATLSRLFNEDNSNPKHIVLRKAFKLLRLLYQEILTLKYVEELSHKEIVEIMGFTSEASSRVILGRAKKQLKKIIQTLLSKNH